MNNLWRYSAIVLLAALCASCKKSDERKCFKSLGEVVTETRDLANFNSIDLQGEANLFIKQGPVQAVEVECPENLMNFIQTEVEDTVLTIFDENKCSFLRNYDHEVNVTVTVTDLKSILYQGYGDIETLDSLDLWLFTYNQWTGSGSANFKIKYARGTYWYLNTGTGDLTISGFGETNYMYAAGNGLLDGRDYYTESVRANSLGTNDIHINCWSKLNAEIEHVGDIYLYGNPINGYSRYGSGTGKIIEQ